MTPEAFSTALRQRPFRPFTVHVGEPTSFYIGSPDQVSPKPASDVVVVLLPEGTGADLISLAHVRMLSTTPQRKGVEIMPPPVVSPLARPRSACTWP
jgi:hypothetical protein